MSLILIERIANLNGPIIPDTLNGVLNGSEIDAHKFIVTATRDGATVALTGTVTASFLRADGAEVVLTGEIEDGAATVTLAQSCYAVPGRFDLTIFVTADGVKTGVYACTGGVRNTTSGTIVDPGQIVPSVDDIIAKQEELAQDVADASSAIASAQNAVSYLAPVFSTSRTYAVGEYVTKDGALYICTTAVETAGAWDATKWQSVTFDKEITDLKARNKLLETATTIVETASGTVASFDDGADGMPVQKLIVNIEPVQAGSGDPSPDNVRPITGWTGAKLTRTGKNLLDKERAVTGERFNTNGTALYSDNARSEYIPVKPNTTYYFKNVHGTVVTSPIYWFDKDMVYISVTGLGSVDPSSGIATSPANAAYVGINFDPSYIDSVAINYPATDTAYHPGHVQTYDIAFPSSAGTVYGGTLTVNEDGTGSLEVDRAMVNAKDVSWSNTGTNGIYHIFSDKVQSAGTAISSHFVPDTYSSSNRVAWNDAIDRADKLAIINGGDVQICYLLATPIAHALTKSEISGIITTLYGANNVWSDTGDISVDYIADTKLYIEKLTQPTEDDMTADHLITSGTFFMVGNSLYLATAQIAAGATITPGTNATKLSLADALNALNS